MEPDNPLMSAKIALLVPSLQFQTIELLRPIPLENQEIDSRADRFTRRNRYCIPEGSFFMGFWFLINKPD